MADRRDLLSPLNLCQSVKSVYQSSAVGERFQGTGDGLSLRMPCAPREAVGWGEECRFFEEFGVPLIFEFEIR